jgi:uncharacterized membrane protein
MFRPSCTFQSGDKVLPTMPANHSFDNEPLTRSEYLTVLTHFYRAEMHRSTVWRMRLDTTTNWSIISVMGLISFTMADSESSHLVIVVGMLLVFTFLVIEARRFRFFDVWRSRVRMLEQHFIGPMLMKYQSSPIEDWGQKVANDLMNPRYKLSWSQALRIRLVRNYLPLFGLLLLIWIIKVDLLGLFYDAEPVEGLDDGVKTPRRLSIWISVATISLLYGYLAAVIAFVGKSPAEGDELWKENFREIAGFDR